MPDLSQFGLGDPAGTVSPAGTFTPAANDPAAAQGSRLNPYLDPGPWGVVDIGNLRLPGVVRSIDGHEKPEEWQVQKATKKSNATTTWKGSKLAEAIKIRLTLPNRAAFDAYYDVRDALQPKTGTEPPVHPIVNPAINFSRIARVSTVNVAPPKWVEALGAWDGEVTVIEYAPEKPNAGGKKPSGPDPNADVKNELQKTLDAAAKA